MDKYLYLIRMGKNISVLIPGHNTTYLYCYQYYFTVDLRLQCRYGCIQHWATSALCYQNG